MWQTWHGREIIALMGPPGSGKSTYASRFPRSATTDALRGQPMTKGKVDAVYNAAFGIVIRALMANQSVVLDTPATNQVTRRRILQTARRFKAKAHLIVFTTPVETCVQRQAGRSAPVPEEVVRKMHADIASQIPNLNREGWTSISFRS